MEFQTKINGIDVNAQYTEENIRNIFLPLLDKVRNIQHEKNGRVIVFLAAPPGAGKSTLAAFLQHLSGRDELQVIGMDGFHRPQAYLKTHTIVRDGKEIPMSEVKGAPETFDAEALTARLKRVAEGENCGWPIYDRNLHEPVDNALMVEADIVLLEGNYLLLNEPGWDELAAMADYTIFIRAGHEQLRERLLARKMKGGLGKNESAAFVEFSDMYNVELTLRKSKKADLMLQLEPDGSYSVPGSIRKATPADISRIAEILVFTKRMKYRAIFNDDAFSFGELQVLPVAEKYADPRLLDHIFVYDDGIVKGLIHIEDDEIAELYVDHFFQNQGVGSALMGFAKANFPVRFLWVLKKNSDSIRFYESHGFRLTDTEKLVPGTPELEVMMVFDPTAC